MCKSLKDDIRKGCGDESKYDHDEMRCSIVIRPIDKTLLFVVRPVLVSSGDRRSTESLRVQLISHSTRSRTLRWATKIYVCAVYAEYYRINAALDAKMPALNSAYDRDSLVDVSTCDASRSFCYFM